VHWLADVHLGGFAPAKGTYPLEIGYKNKRIMRFNLLFLGFLIFIGIKTAAQNDSIKWGNPIKSRVRVIIDNDFGGDPDGLFQLVHHLLSPSVEIKAVIGSQNYKYGFYGFPRDAAYACKQVTEVLTIMKLTDKIKVYEGASRSMTDRNTPIESEGAKAIVREAMNDDKKPLYIVCGAGLTNIASAYLMEPKIADRIILVWIGGPEYSGLGIIPPKTNNPEYNLGIDSKAAQTIYNISNIPIWQIPRNTYRQALYSYSELVYKMKQNGTVGNFLIKKLDDLFQLSNNSLGEAYVLGDSPLVLLTALQSSWEADPSSCKYELRNAPEINDLGLYNEKTKKRQIRVYTQLDTRLMLDDLVAKLSILSKKLNKSTN
jgi:inosine-uridine nucleoside N-ribohydrolase